MMRPINLSPGPSMVSDEVRTKMAEAVDLHHRIPPFTDIWEQLREQLQSFFAISDPRVFFRPSSGTGMMEAAAQNIIGPGDHVLVLNHGAFGERWREILTMYGARITEITAPWGEPIDPRDVIQELRLCSSKQYAAVFMQATDTSTGVINDIEAIGNAVRDHSGALLVVDAIFEAAVSHIPMNDWHIDVLVCASQKAFALPSGLAFLVIAPDAYKRICDRKLRLTYYWDLVRECELNAIGSTACTPAIPHLVGLNYILDQYRAAGSLLYDNHESMAQLLRRVLHEWGLSFFPLAQPSHGITVLALERTGIDSTQIVHELRQRNIIVANGQKHLKGKVLRVAHMGAVDFDDHLEPFLANLHHILMQLGYIFP